MATTTNYGWTTPNDTDLVKNGASAIRTLGSSVDTTLGTALNNKLHSGMVLLSATSVGFNVSTITLTNVFNNTYLNYKIIYSAFQNSGSGAAIYFRYNGVTANYTTSAIAINNSGATSAVAPIGSTITVGYTGSTYNNLEIDVYYPSLNTQSPVSTRFWGSNSFITGGGADTNATARTGFNLTAQSSQTFHYGTVYIYGYAKD